MKRKAGITLIEVIAMTAIVLIVVGMAMGVSYVISVGKAARESVEKRNAELDAYDARLLQKYVKVQSQDITVFVFKRIYSTYPPVYVCRLPDFRTAEFHASELIAPQSVEKP